MSCWAGRALSFAGALHLILGVLGAGIMSESQRVANRIGEKIDTRWRLNFDRCQATLVQRLWVFALDEHFQIISRKQVLLITELAIHGDMPNFLN